jgi:hypothetical protein
VGAPVGTRFEVSQIHAVIAGPQPSAVDAHITTRGDAQIRDVVTVMSGSLVIYCLDAAAVRAFARTWACTLETAEAARVLPERAGHEPGIPGRDRNHVGVILRVQGTPGCAYNVIPAGASSTGLPHARVQVGRLVIEAHDLAAVRSTADGWAVALSTAERVWPDPDAFTAAESRARDLIARTGRLHRN